MTIIINTELNLIEHLNYIIEKGRFATGYERSYWELNNRIEDLIKLLEDAKSVKLK